MDETDVIWMSLVIFLPAAFALLLMFFPRGWEEGMRWWSLAGTAVTLGVSLCMFVQFRYDTIEKQGVLADSTIPSQPDARERATLEARAQAEDLRPVGSPSPADDWLARYKWVPRFNIDYYVGTDGISMPLVILTALLSFLAMIASWRIDRFVRGYCMLFLLLETGMLGTFLALDFFLFYIFWEIMLLPMYFLIGVWGGPRREYAAIKFFLYTLLGSVFILIALLAFYFTNVRDFVNPQLVENEAMRIQQELRPGGQAPLSLEEARKRVVINSFDLMVLQRVGRAALQYLNHQQVTTALSVNGKREDLAKLVAAGASANEVRNARAALHQAEEEMNGRLQDSWFFTPGFQYTMFLLLFIGFAIKVPVFPFHTWLPDAHVEAPTPISMILAGVLLKLGGYGIIRIAYPICPWAAEQLAYYIALFGVINIVYGAFAAMAQTDFKKLVAYSSVSHMGYVILGIAVWSAPEHAQYWSWGMNGAMYQMIAHGITSAGMFFLVGVIYERAHHRNLDNFRGLFEPMPLYGGISAIIFFAAMGLPGMCGFIGEFWVVLSTWNYSPTFAILAAMTVVLTAAYVLWTLQRVFMGQNPHYKNYSDLRVGEIVCIAPLVALSVILGVAPQWVLNWMEPSVTGLVDRLASFR